MQGRGSQMLAVAPRVTIVVASKHTDGYSMALPSSNTPPDGPPGGSRTPHRTLAAPSATERDAFGPPMSVRTHPGLIALTRIPRGASV